MLPKPLQDALNALGVLPLPKPPTPPPATAYEPWRPTPNEKEPPF